MKNDRSSDPERKGRPRRRTRLLRGLGYSALALGAAFAAFYYWQPWEYEVFYRERPQLPPVDPDSRGLFRNGTRVAVIVAHPDDPEFYIGGLLTKLGRAGAEIHMVLCTDGDKGYYPFEDAERNRRVRQAEQREASARYDAEDLAFLGFPDGRLRASEELIEAIARELQRIDPAYVLAFDPEWPDRRRHRDHRLAGVASVEAVRRAGIGEWLLLFSTSAPNYFVDISDLWDEKRSLLAVHKSQFYGERLARIEGLVGGRARLTGQRIGVAYAEGLRVVRGPGP